MPLGSFYPGYGGTMGRSSGAFGPQDHDRVTRIQGTKTIQRWEEVEANPSSTPEERHEAKWAVRWALFPIRDRWFVLNGKRYKTISRPSGLEIRIMPARPKKKK
jgi:hypothetical protein